MGGQFICIYSEEFIFARAKANTPMDKRMVGIRICYEA